MGKHFFLSKLSTERAPRPEPPGHDSRALTHPGLITNTGLGCGCKGSFTTTFLVSLEIFLKKHRAQGASCSRECRRPPDSASRPGGFGPATQLQETPRVKALVGGEKPHTRGVGLCRTSTLHGLNSTEELEVALN